MKYKTFYSMDESWRQHAKWKNSNAKVYILYDSTHEISSVGKSSEAETRWVDSEGREKEKEEKKKRKKYHSGTSLCIPWDHWLSHFQKYILYNVNFVSIKLLLNKKEV